MEVRSRTDEELQIAEVIITGEAAEIIEVLKYLSEERLEQRMKDAGRAWRDQA